MLFVVDIGNTNIKFGVYQGDDLLESWRLSVKVTRTSDEFGILIKNLFDSKGLDITKVEGVIMSSVQPTLNYTVAHACKYYTGHAPIMVGAGIKTGINIKYKNPQEVGTDRIVNSVAAYKLYGGPCIVVDFGTATTFNVVSPKGEFLGGCICPGIKSSLESLVNNTAMLTRIELIKPPSIVGQTTTQNMQAGIIYGFTGLVKHIIEQIKQETGLTNAKVIATGGLSELILPTADGKMIDILDRSLTLKGLKIIYDMNK